LKSERSNTINKEIEQLIKKARSQGWTVEPTRGGHYKWITPSGAFFYSPKTPSEYRSIKNVKRDMKAYGFIEVTKKERRKR
jgi:hypothetical protein